MFTPVKLITRTLGLILSLTVLSSGAKTVSESRGKEPAKFTYAISDIIDRSLSILPDKIETGAKNMLTALEGTVSNVTKNIVSRLDS